MSSPLYLIHTQGALQHLSATVDTRALISISFLRLRL